jgi:hypothetical protein
LSITDFHEVLHSDIGLNCVYRPWHLNRLSAEERHAMRTTSVSTTFYSVPFFKHILSIS